MLPVVRHSGDVANIRRSPHERSPSEWCTAGRGRYQKCVILDPAVTRVEPPPPRWHVAAVHGARRVICRERLIEIAPLVDPGFDVGILATMLNSLARFCEGQRLGQRACAHRPEPHEGLTDPPAEESSCASPTRTPPPFGRTSTHCHRRPPKSRSVVPRTRPAATEAPPPQPTHPKELTCSGRPPAASLLARRAAVAAARRGQQARPRHPRKWEPTLI
jgi:hypothetical protein